MSSLAFCLGLSTPRKLNTCSTPPPAPLPIPCLLIRNLGKTQSSEEDIKISSNCHNHQQNVKTETDFNRRQLIGVGGVCLGLIDVLLQPLPEAAPAASCQLTAAPSGLQFCDQIVGTGPPATKGQLIKAHYVGKLENGKVFDSSYSRGKPLTFRVGVGEVIKGWDQGILGGDGVPPMLAGGKRSLKLPPELGYGVRGAGCRGGSCIIPPDSVLLFDVEFIGKA
ncbi:hypothetical protein Ancab_019152 [Ancistrocladus abbreviatus]